MEDTKTTQNEKKLSLKTIFVILGNVVFYLVIIALFMFSLMNINGGNGQRDFPNLFGRGMLNVLTDSMERKENGYHNPEWEKYSIGEIKVGDLVYVKTFKRDNVKGLHVGDVITFVDEKNLAGKDSLLNTHRIVYVNEEYNYVICQGDFIVTDATTDKYAFDISDPMSQKNAKLDEDGHTQMVAVSDIKGIVTSVHSGKGKILASIRNNWLFYFVIPVALVLVVEIFFVFKNILDLRNEKNKASLATDKEAMAAQIEADKAAMMAEIEAEKERMRQELLAELKAQQAAMNQQPAAEEKPTEEPKAEETTPQEETEEKAE